MALVRPQDITFAVVQNPNVWDTGSAQAVGALSKVEPLPPGILVAPGQEYNVDESLTGIAGRLPFDQGNQIPDWDMSFNARYEGAVNLLVALWFGAEGVVTFDDMAMTPVGGLHTFNVATNLDGKHGTYAADFINAVQEVDFFKVGSIGMNWSSGERLGYEMSAMGRRFRIDSITNTPTELGMVTLEGVRETLIAANLTVLMNEASGAALVGGTDDLCLSAFGVTLDRQLDGPVTSCSTPYREEVVGPQPGWVGQMSAEVPRYQNNDLLNAHLNGTIQKAQIAWVGSAIPGADLGNETYLWQLDLPALTPTEFEWSEQGTIGHTLTFELAQSAIGTPSGMNDPNPELRIQNSRTTVYLT